jgi:HSP20 family molecular chaperone IbpA
MTDSGDFDNIFSNIWGNEEFSEFFENQRNLERTVREYVKSLIESFKKGELQGKSELIPIEKPGVRGFIFRKEFGTPEIPEEVEKAPALSGETSEGKQRFTLPQSAKEEERIPAFETFTDGNEFVALVELPGVEEQDISLEIGDSRISIGAINFKPTQIHVPSNADVSKTTKTYKNGVLEIRVPLKTKVGRDDEVRFGVA